MKILLVARAWPEGDAVETDGACALASGLLERGDAVEVLVAVCRPSRAADVTVEEVDVGLASRKVALHRVLRGDPHPEHWQKSRSSTAGARVRALLAARRFDVLLLTSWRGLSRDLVFLAACARVPAVVLLDGVEPTCLLHTRRLPVSGETCGAPLASTPCLACARRAGPKTPWMPIEAQHVAFAAHRRDVLRELALARAVLVASDADRARLSELLGAEIASSVAGPRGWIDAARAACSRAIEAGAPAAEVASNDWYGARMRAFAESEWDRNALAGGGA